MNFIEPFPKFRSEDGVLYNKRVTKPDIANIYHPAFTGLTFMAADQEKEGWDQLNDCCRMGDGLAKKGMVLDNTAKKTNKKMCKSFIQ